MAAMKASASRFAVLKIEDDDDVQESFENNPESKTSGPPESKQNAKNAKKKSKKKVKAEDIRSDKQANSMSSNKGPKKSKLGKHQTENVENEQIWEEWKRRDEEFVNDVYQEELQEAMLQSKIEYEETRQQRLAAGEDPDKIRKKKPGKKEKPVAMSLDEFNQRVEAEHNHEGAEKVDVGVRGIPGNCGDSGEDFFHKVSNDVDRIINREQRFEQYRKNLQQYEAEAKVIHWEEEIAKRDKVIEQQQEHIEELNTSLSNLKKEFASVKKRNKQLCYILAQGEMKDKAEVLMQMEQLTSIRDELTQQICELHVSLEQERSKVHNLTLELQKHHHEKPDKHEKHGKK